MCNDSCTHIPPQFHGGCFGFSIEPRTKEKNGTDSPVIQMWVEDDGYWHLKKEVSWDNYWTQEIINLLQKVKLHVG